jgi:triacylglycerol esterase/lipase EstA (alpha/beta hydrolase family)
VQSRRTLLTAVLVTAVAAVVVVGALVVADRNKTPVAQDDRGPVLVVPGYGGRMESLDLVISALKADGRDVVEVAPKARGTGDMRAQAANLGRVARKTLRRTHAPSLDVVGYSEGGIVARLFVQKYGGDSIARRVLTIGSPHHGTELAARAQAEHPDRCPKACQQLAPDSDFMKDLNEGDETPAGPRFITISSTTDAAVTPIGTAELDGALNMTVQELCPDALTQHTQLTSDPVVLALVTSALGSGPPTKPTGVTCS